MRSVLFKPDLSHMTANERAQFMCERALQLRDKGDYTGAQEAMRPLSRIRPDHLIVLASRH